MDYIETGTKDFIHKTSYLYGLKNIAVKGSCIIHPQVMIRGDLRRSGGGATVTILLGANCILERDCIIRPPSKLYKSVFSYFPVKIGDFCRIGERSLVEAAQVGSWVEIGNDCIIVCLNCL